MSRLSIDIPETAKSIAEATVHIEGTHKELLDCLGFLAYAVAETIHMPPIIMLAMVAASLSSVQESILEQIKVDLDTIEKARGGTGR